MHLPPLEACMRLPALALIPIALACNETEVNVIEPNPPELELPTRVDRVVQTPVPAVDVLWVIDDSDSMGEEQQALVSSFNAFIRFFIGSGLDYHVGVVTTGWDDPASRSMLRRADGRRWIDMDTPEPVGLFRDMALVGTDGPRDEKGRAQVYGALTLARADGSPNHGFYRDGAALAVIVISDQDDASGERPVSLEAFVDWLVDLKSDPSKVTFSSIVGPDGGCDTADAGTEYLEVTRAVGGFEWSICDPDWSLALEELGIQAAGLQREFYLSGVPVEDSIEVQVVADAGRTESFEQGVDYAYSRSRNSIRFHDFVPEPLAEVRIGYTPLAAARGRADPGQ